tara:strand:- start:40 stop:696 length:657 start_codon:yes stop_codon:yes gene_type:complete
MVVKVHTFKNESPQTPYAPVWDFVIADKETDLDVDELGYIILSKEKEIIEEYPEVNTDGYTGLGKDSLTARFNYFNVLKWDYPVVKDLHNEIRIFHDQYVSNTTDGKFDAEFKIRCWANVMRKGQKIDKHCHATHPHSYLSGHFTVACNDTSTIYFHPYSPEPYPLKNSPNSMTLFPTWMSHKTDSHEVDIPRITVAFDILMCNPDAEITKDDNLVSL